MYHVRAVTHFHRNLSRDVVNTKIPARIRRKDLVSQESLTSLLVNWRGLLACQVLDTRAETISQRNLSEPILRSLRSMFQAEKLSPL